MPEKQKLPKDQKPAKKIDLRAELERMSKRLAQVEAYGKEQVETIDRLRHEVTTTRATMNPLVVALYEACNRTPSMFTHRMNVGRAMIELGEVKGTPQDAVVKAAIRTAEDYFSKP